MLFNSSLRVRLAVAMLLLLHGGLAFDSLRQNSAVNDEVSHLGAGMGHWQRGYFFLYHQNPPLVRMLTCLPVLASRPVTDFSRAARGPDVRSEWAVGRDFMFANAPQYHALVCRARGVSVVLSLVGGWLLFHWARQLFGTAGGLIALSAWAFNPTVLALAGIAVPDMGAAVAGLFAAYAFWKYLGAPSWRRAGLSGAVLGVALLCKFTMLLLVPVWVLLWGVVWWKGRIQKGVGYRCAKHPSGRTGNDTRPLFELFEPRSVFWGQGISMAATALLVINAGYAFQETCRPLGSFQFVSRPMLGRDARPPGTPPWETVSGNRWRDSWMAWLPMPVPAEYLLGLDAQQRDFERGFSSYLRGEMRQRGWWHYYLYGFAVKTPVGTLLLIGVTFLVMWRSSFRSDWLSESLIWLPALAVLVVVSAQTGFNHHVRYVFPAYPFIFLVQPGEAYIP